MTISIPKRTGLRGTRIFVVEDNLANRVIMELILEHAGAALGFEETGQQVGSAMQAFGSVDLILLDLMLPQGRTGFEILKEIRAIPEYASVPVVAVSARDAGEIIPSLREAGFAGLLSKPIAFERFARQLIRVLTAEEFVYVAATPR
jgi:CheY-like chemotaxis protein